MSIPDHTEPRTCPATDAPTSPAQLVHELANLLDASLRNVGLVLSELHHQVGDDHDVDHGDDDAWRQRLDVANGAMQQMAMLMRRWMHHNRASQTLYTQRVTLGCGIDQAVRLLEAAAMSRQITITTHVTDGARQLPVGPLYPIIANALRNSLEAITQDPAQGHGGAIELDCHVDGDQMILALDDTGPGLDPALLDGQGHLTLGRTTKLQGHGLGLGLSQQIAGAVGGTVALSNRQPRGARFLLRCPVARLVATAEADHLAPPVPPADQQRKQA